MRYLLLLLAIPVSACSNIKTTATNYCDSSGPVEIIHSKPSSEYKTCGNIQVNGRVINNQQELNKMLLSAGRELNADAVLPLQRIDEFNWADGRVIRVNAVALQYQ